MIFRRSVTLVAAAVAMSTNPMANAAQPLALNQQSFQELNNNFAIQLPGDVRMHHSVKADSLKFLKQRTDKNKVSHIRMQQHYQGVPVFGGYAIAHSKQQARGLMGAAPSQVTLTGKVYKDLGTELGVAPQGFQANAQKALVHFQKQYSAFATREATVTPMVFIDTDNQAHWAYKVSVFVSHNDAIPERPTAIIDARSYAAFVAWNDVKTERTPAKATGFGGNEKAGKVQYGDDLALLEITRDEDENQCFLENTDVKVVDMEHRYSSRGNPMKFTCVPASEDEDGLFWTGYEGNGYDEENGAYSPSNDALYAGYVIKRMYQDWYNEEVLTKPDGEAMQLVMRVHYGSNYENAYWDGKQMTFGDGYSMMYPLVSLGVGAHEVSHGFTEQHSDLNYYGQSGGMNESFSDMAAMAAEHFSVGEESWQIGAEIMKEDSGYDALRFMDQPSRDGRSIDSADEYYGGLDVHYSSGVFNRLFYLMATTEGWNTRKAFDVMVKANMDYWTPYTNFKEGGCGVLNAAKDLGYNLDDIKAALDKVVIDYSSCFGDA